LEKERGAKTLRGSEARPEKAENYGRRSHKKARGKEGFQGWWVTGGTGGPTPSSYANKTSTKRRNNRGRDNRKSCPPPGLKSDKRGQGTYRIKKQNKGKEEVT